MSVAYSFDAQEDALSAVNEVLGALRDGDFRIKELGKRGISDQYLIFPKDAETLEQGKEIASVEYNGAAERPTLTVNEGTSRQSSLFLGMVGSLAQKFGGSKNKSWVVDTQKSEEPVLSASSLTSSR